MANYQLASVEEDALILGNNTIEVAGSALATFSDLGAGMVTSWDHPIEKYSVQAGNAPDPIAGIASEECKVEFELMEFDASVLSVISGDQLAVSTASSSAAASAPTVGKRSRKRR